MCSKKAMWSQKADIPVINMKLWWTCLDILVWGQTSRVYVLDILLTFYYKYLNVMNYMDYSTFINKIRRLIYISNQMKVPT